MSRFMGRERIELKSPEEILAMRKSGLVTAAALEAVRAQLVPGAQARDIDQVAAEAIRQAGAEPNFLNYQGYPASICLSINDVVVHGIPGSQVLRPGDLVSIDCGAVLNGWHSDSAITQAVGPVGARAEVLMEVTRKALWDGIAAFAQATYVGEIGAAIEASVQAAEPSFAVLRDFVGHGIGRAMHMAPEVLNFASRQRGPKIRPGMVLAIEPMVVEGKPATSTDRDGWTVRTVDASLSAHWEHTVARTETGIWVLTAPDGGEAELAARGITIAPLA
ncbi:MAG: type I methionyl aminopeptidase [Bifidobacteriaceae bacterium]|jgi:methionyl aminopeptidase|nr:type I methionyl aminopeptidase [Bifidobacteriaceae bacterium]